MKKLAGFALLGLAIVPEKEVIMIVCKEGETDEEVLAEPVLELTHAHSLHED